MSAIENLPEPTEDFDDEFEEFVENETSELTPWDIQNEDDAAEAMRRLAYWDSRVNAINAMRDSQVRQIDRWRDTRISQIDDWADGEVEKLVRKLTPYRQQLMAHLQRLMKANPKKKSLPYAAGKLSHKDGSTSVVVSDPDKFMKFADANPALKPLLVRVPEPKPAPALSEITKAVKEEKLSLTKNGELVDPSTGNIIDGVTIVRGEPKFDFKFADTPETEA